MSPHAHLAAATDPAFTATSRTTGEIVRRVAVYLRPYKWMAVANVGCAVLSLAFALAYPQLIGLVIDQVIGEKQADPTHSAVMGIKLAEKLKEVGIEAILVYPGHSHPQYKNSADYLIDRLRK